MMSLMKVCRINSMLLLLLLLSCEKQQETDIKNISEGYEIQEQLLVQGVVNSDNVNIRKIPILKKDNLIGQVSKGEELIVKGKSKNTMIIGNKDNYWLWIEYEDTLGWIYGAYVDIKTGNIDNIPIHNITEYQEQFLDENIGCTVEQTKKIDYIRQDDTSALEVRLSYPRSLVYDEKNDVLYIGDNYNNRIRKLEEGYVSTLIGDGSDAGKDGCKTDASFVNIYDLIVGPLDEMYVLENRGQRIRKIDEEGYVKTVISSLKNITIEDDLFSQKTEYRGIRDPQSMMFYNNMLYVIDGWDNQIFQIDIMRQKAKLIAGIGIAGFHDGRREEGLFRNPTGIAIANNGTIYVADTGNHAIRKIDTEGRVSTIAGSGTMGFQDGKGEEGLFRNPTGIAIANNGTIYVADTGNHAIRKIDTEGRVSTIAGSGTMGFQDGKGKEGLFRNPTGIVIANNGTIYVADTGNHAIRKIDVDSNVSTVAGSGMKNHIFLESQIANYYYIDILMDIRNKNISDINFSNGDQLMIEDFIFYDQVSDNIIYLEQEPYQIIEILGKATTKIEEATVDTTFEIPYHQEKDIMNIGYKSQEFEGGDYIEFSGTNFRGIKTRNKRIKTLRGLKIGDSEHLITGLYGNSMKLKKKKDTNGVEHIYWEGKSNNLSQSTSKNDYSQSFDYFYFLRFSIDNGQISEMTMFKKFIW